MADERKIYPPINEVHLQQMPTSQAPSNPQAPAYSLPQTPPYAAPQSPPNNMTRLPQVPLGPTPTAVTCPSCGASVQTNIRVEPSTQTHLMALVLCLLCICCTCVPYCVDSCQDANHHCPNCDAYLGTYKR